MEHVPESVRAKQVLNEIAVQKGALDEGRVGRDILAHTPAQVVQHDDIVSLFEETLSDVRADEPGAAGY
jgi:hypothetical protein